MTAGAGDPASRPPVVEDSLASCTTSNSQQNSSPSRANSFVVSPRNPPAKMSIPPEALGSFGEEPASEEGSPSPGTAHLYPARIGPATVAAGGHAYLPAESATLMQGQISSLRGENTALAQEVAALQDTVQRLQQELVRVGGDGPVAVPSHKPMGLNVEGGGQRAAEFGGRGMVDAIQRLQKENLVLKKQLRDFSERGRGYEQRDAAAEGDAERAALAGQEVEALQGENAELRLRVVEAEEWARKEAVEASEARGGAGDAAREVEAMRAAWGGHQQALEAASARVASVMKLNEAARVEIRALNQKVLSAEAEASDAAAVASSILSKLEEAQEQRARYEGEVRTAAKTHPRARLRLREENRELRRQVEDGGGGDAGGGAGGWAPAAPVAGSPDLWAGLEWAESGVLAPPAPPTPPPSSPSPTRGGTPRPHTAAAGRGGGGGGGGGGGTSIVLGGRRPVESDGGPYTQRLAGLEREAQEAREGHGRYRGLFELASLRVLELEQTFGMLAMPATEAYDELYSEIRRVFPAAGAASPTRAPRPETAATSRPGTARPGTALIRPETAPGGEGSLNARRDDLGARAASARPRGSVSTSPRRGRAMAGAGAALLEGDGGEVDDDGYPGLLRSTNRIRSAPAHRPQSGRDTPRTVASPRYRMAAAASPTPGVGVAMRPATARPGADPAAGGGPPGGRKEKIRFANDSAIRSTSIYTSLQANQIHRNDPEGGALRGVGYSHRLASAPPGRRSGADPGPMAAPGEHRPGSSRRGGALSARARRSSAYGTPEPVFGPHAAAAAARRRTNALGPKHLELAIQVMDTIATEEEAGAAREAGLRLTGERIATAVWEAPPPVPGPGGGGGGAAQPAPRASEGRPQRWSVDTGRGGPRASAGSLRMSVTGEGPPGRRSSAGGGLRPSRASYAGEEPGAGEGWPRSPPRKGAPPSLHEGGGVKQAYQPALGAGVAHRNSAGVTHMIPGIGPA